MSLGETGRRVSNGRIAPGPAEEGIAWFGDVIRVVTVIFNRGEQTMTDREHDSKDDTGRNRDGGESAPDQARQEEQKQLDEGTESTG